MISAFDKMLMDGFKSGMASTMINLENLIPTYKQQKQ